MPVRSAALICVFDATEPTPATDLPAAVELVADASRIVLAVLHPPPPLTLDARLIAGRGARRSHVTAAVLAPVLARLRATRLAERDVRVHTTALCLRHGSGARHRRVAAALLGLCRAHDADMLVVPGHPGTRLITPRTRLHLVELAPSHVRIRYADERDPSDTVSLRSHPVEQARVADLRHRRSPNGRMP